MSKNAQPEVIGIAPVPTKPKKKKDDSYELMDFAPDEIARQLTLIDWELSSKVPLKEMLRARWIKNQAPHLESTSSRVNDVREYYPSTASLLTGSCNSILLSSSFYFQISVGLLVCMANCHDPVYEEESYRNGANYQDCQALDDNEQLQFFDGSVFGVQFCLHSTPDTVVEECSCKALSTLPKAVLAHDTAE
jgi:hypothetical protein